jgi:hypothetical protein
MGSKDETGQASEEDSLWVYLLIKKIPILDLLVSVNAKKLCVCVLIISILVQDTQIFPFENPLLI